jgi:hypothetical protein
MALFFVGGYITFINNNRFATSPENIAKIIVEYDHPEKIKLVEELLEEDANTYEEENNIGSQAFNVVLGAIVSFLSTTLTRKR